MKPSIVVGTAGHIDHGKSALVRALTGTDPDRLKEEQERGITIDLGFAHLDTGDATLSFVDVPGHERFVKNMLAGAGGIDAVLLVIAADESVMPQTREHFQICRLLEVPAGIVALTKADLVDADIRELAVLEARELIEGTFLEGAAVLQVSSKTGEGLDRLRAELGSLARRVRARSSAGPARLPVDRVFTMRGFGTVVTGTLVSGAIAEDDELEVLPDQRRVKVRSVQVHGRRETRANAGRRVALNLGGVEVAEIARGRTLVEPGAFESTRRVDVRLDLLADARPLRHGARVRFHQGTSEAMGRVAIGVDAAAAVNPGELAPGGRGFARLRLEAPAVLTRGDRFIVRAYSPPVTIGGGVVLDPHPPRVGVRTSGGAQRFRALGAGDREAVMLFLRERGAAGLLLASLIARAGLTRDGAQALVEDLTRAGAAVAVGDRLVATDVLRALERELLDALETHHRENPLAEGMPREEARERIFGRASPDVFAHVVHALSGSGRIVARDVLARAGRRLSLSAEEQRVQSRLGEMFREAGLAPPDPGTAASTALAPREVVDRMIALLVRQRVLVKVETLVFHADALEALKRDVRLLKGEAGEGAAAQVGVAAFKERYGISRKYAIPLLEYLDRERVTRRVGEARIVL